jgi:hypothetical protein
LSSALSGCASRWTSRAAQPARSSEAASQSGREGVEAIERLVVGDQKSLRTVAQGDRAAFEVDGSRSASVAVEQRMDRERRVGGQRQAGLRRSSARRSSAAAARSFTVLAG